MEKKYYISKLEKEAAFNINSVKKFARKGKDFAVDKALDNSGKIGAGVAGLTGLGTGYALSDKKDRATTKSVVKKGARTYIDANVAGETAEIVRGLSGLAGAGLALARGRKSPKQIVKSGLAGFAIGDVGSSAMVPALQLKKKMKKELNRTPTKEEYAKVIAGNAGGPAALWGGLYSMKKGRKILNKMQGNGVDIISGIKKATNDFKAGAENLVKDVDGPITKEKMKELFKTEDGMKIKDTMKTNMKSIGKKGLGIAVPLGVMDEVAQLPSYTATPKNITDSAKKKEKIEG